MKNNKKIADTFLIGAILAVVGGYLDAYTYLCRGNVFANAQTGNIVLFGIKLSHGDFQGAKYYVVPIIAFIIGILVAETVKHKFIDVSWIHWRQITVVIEIITLFFVAFLPLGKMNVVANVLVSFACSLQVESFRKLKGNPYATTMCTGNLRSATEQMFLFIRSKDKYALMISLQYYGIIAFFIMGACIGTVLTKIWEEKAVLFSCLGLMFVWLIIHVNKTFLAVSPKIE